MNNLERKWAQNSWKPLPTNKATKPAQNSTAAQRRSNQRQAAFSPYADRALSPDCNGESGSKSQNYLHAGKMPFDSYLR